MLATVLARAQWPALAVTAAAVAAVYGRIGLAHLAGFWRVARRLRYLFLSIAVVYLWFTPGAFLVPAWGEWSPTWPGLEQGLQRVAALLVLVGAVQSMLICSTRSELLAAIRWWARPLALTGLSPDRLAMRMVLTMEAVPRLRQLVAEREVPPELSRLRRLGGFAGAVFAAAVADAQQVECPLVELPALPPPPLRQWLLPLLTGLLLLL